MGNSQTSSFRAAISDEDIPALSMYLQNSTASTYINEPLNRKGDSPLILAARLGKVAAVRAILATDQVDVNFQNRQLCTALDVALESILPHDADIIHYHFCPYSHTDPSNFAISELVKVLLKARGRGKNLERLILHCMKDDRLIGEVINLLDDVHRPSQFRISGLLLQIAVWFDQRSNLELLLRRGVDLENFWRSSFMPRFQPCPCYRPVSWPKTDEGDYVVTPDELPNSYAVQSLKFSFVQDWRADWNDGENPSAQYRAALQLTPEGAVLFARAANTYRILMRVMNDVMGYNPSVSGCDGPKLDQTPLVQCLYMAGYCFTQEEVTHLQLKFKIDFSNYEHFLRQPKELKHLCRMCVRRNVKMNMYAAVQALSPLPAEIKGYLMLNDIGTV